MVNQIDLLFGNLFNRVNITTFRLLAFAHYHLAALYTQNQNGINDDAILKLSQQIQEVQNGMDEFDYNLAIQLSKTGTVDGIVEEFERFMSVAYVDLAYQTKSHIEVLQQFYPRGKSEFNKISRTDAELFMNRVHEIATMHATLLEPELHDQLCGFKARFEAARELQMEQIGTVESKRSKRNAARPGLETMLTEMVREIGRRYPCDIHKGKSYFNWSLLHAPGYHKKRKKKPIAPSE
jgi:hypothetical protein